MEESRLIQALSTVAVGAFAVLGLLIPLAGVFGALDLQSFLDPSVLSAARATAGQALLSTFFSAALGLPLGIAMGRAGGAGARAILAVPFGVPSLVVATTGVVLLGTQGLDWAYQFKAIILAHVFLNAPLVALHVLQARADLPQSRWDAARSLGGRGLRLFAEAEWPLIRIAFSAACAQVFALCAMSFALVMILGGGPPVQTLETALYSHLRFAEIDFARASACAAWELLLTLLPWLILMRLRRREQGQSRGQSWNQSWDEPYGSADSVRRLQSQSSRGARAGWAGVASLFVVPYLILVRPAQLLRLFGQSEVRAALGSTLVLAVFSALLATLLSLASIRCARRSAAAAWLASLPAGVSVLVIGLGYWLNYARLIDPVQGGMLPVVLIQATLFVPVGFRILWPVALRRRESLLQAAASLGASPWAAFLAVEWPRWRGPLLRAYALCFAASLGEVAAVSLFQTQSWVNLPLLVLRRMQQYRFDEAEAIAGALLLLGCGVTLAAGALEWGGQDAARV